MGFINNLDKQYTDLLKDILENGTRKIDRTGTGTISVFGRQFRHKMSEGFPLLTTKKMPFKTIVTELIWFLEGRTDLKYLLDNDCDIWTGDAYQAYLKKCKEEDLHDYGKPFSREEFIERIKNDENFSKRFGDLGPIYGSGWRNFEGIDQIRNLIKEIKLNPDSRRLIVSAWQPHKIKYMVLPPCHTDFQIYTRELTAKERIELVGGKIQEKYPALIEQSLKVCDEINIPTRAISLMWKQRSVDTFLGLPFNIASYGLLLEILAKEVNMVPEELIGNLGDVHLYSNHVDQAIEQIGRDLTDEERYNIWFNNNYETGMERYFNPNNLPDFNNSYYEPTPKRTREPFPLPSVTIKNNLFSSSLNDFILKDYKSHPKIKAPLSN